MKCAVDNGSVAMTYIPSFRLTVSKFDRVDTQAYRQHGDVISLILFFLIQ
jgi:hypothetical protein